MSIDTVLVSMLETAVAMFAFGRHVFVRVTDNNDNNNINKQHLSTFYDFLIARCRCNLLKSGLIFCIFRPVAIEIFNAKRATIHKQTTCSTRCTFGQRCPLATWESSEHLAPSAPCKDQSHHPQ